MQSCNWKLGISPVAAAALMALYFWLKKLSGQNVDFVSPIIYGNRKPWVNQEGPNTKKQ